MNNLTEYSGITTKIRAMESRLITHANILELASMRQVSEFVLFLKQHESYADLFARFDENNLHRGQIEAILTNAKYNEYAKIYRFLSMKQRNFLVIYFFRFEIDIIKTCLRMLFDERGVTYNLSIFEDFFSTHSHLNIQKLASCTTIAEFIQNLENTPYQKVLTQVTGEAPSLFDYENSLDIYYFTFFWKHKNKTLKGKELTLITEEVGAEIDLHNLLSLYRVKNYFQVDTNALYAYMIPFNYKIKKKELTKLLEASSMEEFMELFYNTIYYRMYHTLYKGNMEQFCKSIIRKLHQEHIRRYPYSVAFITNYLYLKDIEIHTLTTTLECIRYQLGPSESLQYLQNGGVKA